ADVTQPTYHDVSGVGDAADFQGAAQARPQEIIGNYGRENGRQGGAYDAEAADKHFLPATLWLVHVRARGDHAHRPVQAVAYTLIRSENPQVINQRARDHDAQQSGCAHFDREIDFPQGAPDDAPIAAEPS